MSPSWPQKANVRQKSEMRGLKEDKSGVGLLVQPGESQAGVAWRAGSLKHIGRAPVGR
jgi:hypothetical protein